MSTKRVTTFGVTRRRIIAARTREFSENGADWAEICELINRELRPPLEPDEKRRVYKILHS